jgi:hypothetical protein
MKCRIGWEKVCAAIDLGLGSVTRVVPRTDGRCPVDRQVGGIAKGGVG